MTPRTPDDEAGCPEDDMLIALVEHSLDPDLLEQLAGHVDTCERCRATVGLLAAVDPMTKASVGRYQLEDLLGIGGMGVVWAAWDPMLERRVAIKLLSPDVGEHGPARLLREARALAQLQHPNVVAVHDVGEHEGEVFVATELIDGEPLNRWQLARSTDEILDAYIQAARGLAAAHAIGLVHRDIKPSNLLVARDGRVRVSDFGLARRGDVDPERSTVPVSRDVMLTNDGAVVGTPAYMAPEQRDGRPVDGRADQYALCVALAEALGGKRPEPDAAAKTLGIEPPIAAVLAKGVRRDPASRFADMTTLAESLAGATRSRGRRGILLAAVGALVLAFGVVGFAVLHRPDDPPNTAGPAVDPSVVAKRRKIALLPFVDRTHNPVLDFTSAGLPTSLGFELRGVPDVTVIGYYQILDKVSGPEAAPADWVAAARRLGADVVVHGELTAASDPPVHVVISVDAANGDHIDAIEFDAQVKSVPEMVRDAATRVAKVALGRDVLATAHASPSFAGDRELQLAIADIERENFDDGSAHLRTALRLDPDLPLAHYYLALVLYWQAPPAEPARAEIERTLGLDLDDAQRSFLNALRLIVDQHHTRAIEQLQRLTELYPDDKHILYALFEALFHGGQPVKAMSVYRRIVAVAPRFRLALSHCFTYYVAHDDEAGMTWALGLADPAGGPYPRWELQVLVARREYDAAKHLLWRLIADATDRDTSAGFEAELVPIFALSDRMKDALALARELGDSKVRDLPAMMFGLSLARGDADGRAHWLDVWIRSLATSTPASHRHAQWEVLAGAALRSSSHAELVEISKQVNATVALDSDRSVNLNTIQAMIADALGDHERLAELAKSPYPETAGTAMAAIARRAGDHVKAASAMRLSIAAAAESRFIIDQWALLASDLHASNDHLGVIGACDEVIRPRLFSWAWASNVGDCLAWTAEAAEALGRPADARVAWRRLVALRSAAPVGDRLVEAARAGLARLGN